ncbi:unnamed protein product [Cylindrotheca closterium]|uniref:Uncharacterized protein n=1 Tax=Cylindrotheca closterium TaxID=2856 RepID=A0AAD2FIK5_9STRA|nr:unnamed protein product [Cylindrotheca closterium]
MAPKQEDIENGERLVSRKKLYGKSSTLETVTSTVSLNGSEDGDFYDDDYNYYHDKECRHHKDAMTNSSEAILIDTQKPACYRICDLKYRVSTKPTEPWGHKPHPMLGASCFLFALPIPFLTTCYPCTAALFGLTTLSSFLSDYLYSGLDSWAHVFDKTVAILVFSFASTVVYSTAGLWWTLSSSLALACYVKGMEAVKRKDYHGFVFWHSMWHLVGVSLLVLVFALHGTRTECLVA